MKPESYLTESYPRRSYLKTALAGLGLKTVLAGVGLTAGASALSAQETKKNPIVLYVDMLVDPSREKEMVDNYHKIFRPAAVKFPGFIDLKIVKLRTALQGSAPAGMNYRFQLTYQSEELRQKWIASDVHQKVWPTIERTLTNPKDYTVLLCDAI